MFGIGIEQILVLALIAVVLFGGFSTLVALVQPRVDTAVSKRARLRKVAPEVGTVPESAQERIKRSDVKSSVQDAIKKNTEYNRRVNRFTLEMGMERAGWVRGKNVFLSLAGVSAFVFAMFGFVLSPPFGAVAGAILGGVGLPFWYLKIMGARRKNQFLADLPAALEVISRTVRGGLPITDAIRIAGTDAYGPIRIEFLKVHDAVAIGRPLEEAIQDMYRRIPSQEINFMALVIGIQQRTGGNLTEVIDSLANMLRERVIIQKRVVAMTSEITMSATIIGVMPFITLAAFYYLRPDYTSLLWTTDLGRTIFSAGVIWALVGAVAMWQMIKIKV